MPIMKDYKYLFLDRDGVINEERPNDYVKNISEFIFTDNALEALNILSNIFDRIFIVTNQRGIGKGIMSTDQLTSIHDYMSDTISKSGGHIDKIYFCTDVCSTSINRKPNIGMAFQAKRDFPEVSFRESVFIGNSRSDIDFANKLEMYSVLVGDKYEKEDKIYKKVNSYCENLYKFAYLLKSNGKSILL